MYTVQYYNLSARSFDSLLILSWKLGILFKFCLDQVIETQPEPVWMYGGKQPSDEYGNALTSPFFLYFIGIMKYVNTSLPTAMKVGGLEMQGLDIWQINSMGGAMALRVPLMALVCTTLFFNGRHSNLHCNLFSVPDY